MVRPKEIQTSIEELIYALQVTQDNAIVESKNDFASLFENDVLYPRKVAESLQNAFNVAKTSGDIQNLKVILQTLSEVKFVAKERLSWFEGISFLGIISSFAWGLGYQPHILVRFMSIRSTREINLLRLLA